MKRKVTLVAILCTLTILGYISFIAWFVGFVLAKYFGSDKVGEPSRLKSWCIPLGRYRVHLHHWLLSSFAVILFTIFKGAYVLPPDLFYGFFGAIIFHGIYCYSDWHKILIARQAQSLYAEEQFDEVVASITNLPPLNQKAAKE